MAVPGLEQTELSKIPEIVARLRAGFKSHRTRDYDYRMTQLRNFKKLLEENKERIFDSLKHDLNKCKTEAFMMEYSQVVGDTVDMLNGLADWMSPQHKPRDLLNKFNTVFVQAEPYGVVLNIVPWNYPFQIMMSSLVGIIAAGNCCVIKPSEFAVAYSNLIAELIPKYLDPECFAVVTGEIDQAKALLNERWSFIMFTGAPSIGKLVMKTAAETLTPVLLELGGKSPVIVADDANVGVAGRRIMWGKCMNAGQTCIAPDYVLCVKGTEDRLLEACKKSVTEFYGENPKDSADYGRIIHERHFNRVVGLLDGSKGTVAYGGDRDVGTRYIQPTLVTGVSTDDKLMQEEIFGPILPFVTVDSVEQAIEYVNEHEKPLAMYVFTENKGTFQQINRLTSAGGVCHNDTLMHAGVTSLPFGGVGNSGCGAYRGKHSFDAFSHFKGVLSTGTGLEALNSMRYPPFTPSKLSRIQFFLSKSERSGRGYFKMMFLLVAVATVGVLVQMYGLPSWLF